MFILHQDEMTKNNQSQQPLEVPSNLTIPFTSSMTIMRSGASCVVKSEVPGHVPRLSNAYDSKTRPSQLHRSSPSASGSEARETGSYQRQLLARGRNKNTPPATKVDLAVVACCGLFFSDTYCI